jgi:uncharacterized protein (DUF1499 family)
MAFACVSIIFGLAAMNIIWRTGCKGAAQLSFGLLLGCLLFSLPVYLAAQAYRLPLLNDVSTDLNLPPMFSLSKAALVTREFHTPENLAPAARAQQEATYRNVQTIRVDLNAAETFELLLKLAASNGWQIVEAHPPGGRMGLGHLDAIAKSRILNFAADVAIRVKPLGDETLVDMRSVSRLGPSDFGENAKRIEDFIDLVQTQADRFF